VYRSNQKLASTIGTGTHIRHAYACTVYDVHVGVERDVVLRLSAGWKAWKDVGRFGRAANLPWRDTSTSPFLNCLFVRFLFLILVRIWSAMCDRATFSTRNLESLMAVLNQLKQQGSRNFLVSAMDYNIGENQSVFYGFLVKKQNQKN
jgi:hypothetical protein